MNDPIKPRNVIDNGTFQSWYDQIGDWYTVAGYAQGVNAFQFDEYQAIAIDLIQEEQKEFAAAENREEALDAVADILVTQLGGIWLNFPVQIGRPTVAQLSVHYTLPSAGTSLAWFTLLGFSHADIIDAMEAVLKSNWSKFKVLTGSKKPSTLESLQAKDKDIVKVEVKELNGKRYEVVFKNLPSGQLKIGKHPDSYQPPVFKAANETSISKTKGKKSPTVGEGSAPKTKAAAGN